MSWCAASACGTSTTTCAPPGRSPAAIVFRPGHVESDAVDVTEARDGSALLVAQRAGRRVALEHRRADGTLAVLDERGRASGPPRLVTAFDEAGEPVRQWTGAWELYADWFDGLIGTERAFALTDSKTVANFMAEYRRPNLVSLHVVHNSHLDGAEPALRARAPVAASGVRAPRAIRRRRLPHRTAARGCRGPPLRPRQPVGRAERDRPARRRSGTRPRPGPRAQASWSPGSRGASASTTPSTSCGSAGPRACR